MGYYNHSVIITLLTNKTAYLMFRPSLRNPKGYGLFVGNRILVGKLTERQFYVLKDIVKVDKKNNKITINLKLVRQMHGKSFIKQQYKKLKK